MAALCSKSKKSRAEIKLSVRSADYTPSRSSDYHTANNDSSIMSTQEFGWSRFTEEERLLVMRTPRGRRRAGGRSGARASTGRGRGRGLCKNGRGTESRLPKFDHVLKTFENMCQEQTGANRRRRGRPAGRRGLNREDTISSPPPLVPIWPGVSFRSVSKALSPDGSDEDVDGDGDDDDDDDDEEKQESIHEHDETDSTAETVSTGESEVKQEVVSSSNDGTEEKLHREQSTEPLRESVEVIEASDNENSASDQEVEIVAENITKPPKKQVFIDQLENETHLRLSKTSEQLIRDLEKIDYKPGDVDDNGVELSKKRPKSFRRKLKEVLRRAKEDANLLEDYTEYKVVVQPDRMILQRLAQEQEPTKNNCPSANSSRNRRGSMHMNHSSQQRDHNLHSYSQSFHSYRHPQRPALRPGNHVVNFSKEPLPWLPHSYAVNNGLTDTSYNYRHIAGPQQMWPHMMTEWNGNKADIRTINHQSYAGSLSRSTTANNRLWPNTRQPYNVETQRSAFDVATPVISPDSTQTGDNSSRSHANFSVASSHGPEVHSSSVANDSDGRKRVTFVDKPVDQQRNSASTVATVHLSVQELDSSSETFELPSPAAQNEDQHSTADNASLCGLSSSASPCGAAPVGDQCSTGNQSAHCLPGGEQPQSLSSVVKKMNSTWPQTKEYHNREEMGSETNSPSGAPLDANQATECTDTKKRKHLLRYTLPLKKRRIRPNLDTEVDEDAAVQNLVRTQDGWASEKHSSSFEHCNIVVMRNPLFNSSTDDDKAENLSKSANTSGPSALSTALAEVVTEQLAPLQAARPTDKTARKSSIAARASYDLTSDISAPHSLTAQSSVWSAAVTDSSRDRCASTLRSSYLQSTTHDRRAVTTSAAAAAAITTTTATGQQYVAAMERLEPVSGYSRLRDAGGTGIGGVEGSRRGKGGVAASSPVNDTRLAGQYWTHLPLPHPSSVASVVAAVPQTALVSAAADGGHTRGRKAPSSKCYRSHRQTNKPSTQSDERAAPHRPSANSISGGHQISAPVLASVPLDNSHGWKLAPPPAAAAAAAGATTAGAGSAHYDWQQQLKQRLQLQQQQQQQQWSQCAYESHDWTAAGAQQWTPGCNAALAYQYSAARQQQQQQQQLQQQQQQQQREQPNFYQQYQQFSYHSSHKTPPPQQQLQQQQQQMLQSKQSSYTISIPEQTVVTPPYYHLPYPHSSYQHHLQQQQQHQHQQQHQQQYHQQQQQQQYHQQQQQQHQQWYAAPAVNSCLVEPSAAKPTGWSVEHSSPPKPPQHWLPNYQLML